METPDTSRHEEKRRHPRFDVSEVHGSLQVAMDVHVQNLSVSGMAVETSARLTVGRSYRFKLKNGDRLLPLVGTVAWSYLHRTRRNESGEVEPVYRAGIRFEDVLTDNAKALIELLEERAVVKLDKRIFGRFPVPAVDGVEVDSEGRFSVRRLSLSGMLIEADVVPERGEVLHAEIDLGQGPMRVKLRVVTEELLENGDGTQAARLGVEFVDLSPDQYTLLEDFLARQFSQHESH